MTTTHTQTAAALVRRWEDGVAPHDLPAWSDEAAVTMRALAAPRVPHSEEDDRNARAAFEAWHIKRQRARGFGEFLKDYEFVLRDESGRYVTLGLDDAFEAWQAAPAAAAGPADFGRAQHARDSAELRRLCGERDKLRADLATLQSAYTGACNRIGTLLIEAKRLDWLETMVVNVRQPLRYGSHDRFWASPEDVDGGPAGPSDIRKQIDAARAAPPSGGAG